MNRLIIAVLAMAFVSCLSPAKKLSKLIESSPELFKNDTIEVRDTFFVKKTELDTTVGVSIDTITIMKERMIIKYYYNSVLGTNYVYGKCDADTVFILKKIGIKKVDYLSLFYERLLGRTKFFFLVFLFLFFAVVIYRLTK